MAGERSRGTKLLYWSVTWVGIGFFSLGSLGTLWSLWTFIQVRTGWGLTPLERCCLDLGKASLGGVLASMFFVLIGSAVILLLHPVRVHLWRTAGTRPHSRWLRVFAAVMGSYALAVFALATFLAGIPEELEGFAVGIVTYCMLVGVGMLAAAWGFKRASEAG
ncbi:MAG: hypothetical protein M3238_00085 [Actinomycetota bacterium]|nr:hypothetical protein [Actinomycetota bacterium]